MTRRAFVLISLKISGTAKAIYLPINFFLWILILILIQFDKSSYEGWVILLTYQIDSFLCKKASPEMVTQKRRRCIHDLLVNVSACAMYAF